MDVRGNARSLEVLRLRWGRDQEATLGRLGKTAGWILDLIIHSCGEGLSYEDIVSVTGMRKDKVKEKVKKLIEAGLVRPQTVSFDSEHTLSESVFVLKELAHKRLEDQLEGDGSIRAENRCRKRVMEERQRQLDGFLKTSTRSKDAPPEGEADSERAA